MPQMLMARIMYFSIAWRIPVEFIATEIGSLVKWRGRILAPTQCGGELAGCRFSYVHVFDVILLKKNRWTLAARDF
jgi:hypothetical protein